jgi:hypothetical protein
LLFPFVEKKLFLNNKIKLYYLSLFISLFSILFILILAKVAIYDELRHIMFLFPIIFILSLFNFYRFNNKFFYTFAIILIPFLIIDNFKLNPYQYTWLNSFARYTDIQKNFELDYWGISNKNLQKSILNISEKENIDSSSCVYGDIYNKAFLENKNFTCFKRYSSIDNPEKRPFFAYQNIRNLKKSDPKDCSLKYLEQYNYLFFDQKLIMGKVWLCN